MKKRNSSTIPFGYKLLEDNKTLVKVDKELFLTKIRELYLEKGNERSYTTLFNMAFGPVRGRLPEKLEFYLGR